MIHISVWVFYVVVLAFFASGFLLCSLLTANRLKDTERRHYRHECELQTLCQFWEQKAEAKERDGKG